MKPKKLITVLVAFTGLVLIFFLIYTIQTRTNIHQNVDLASSDSDVVSRSSSTQHDKNKEAIALSQGRKGPLYFQRAKSVDFCKFSNLQSLLTDNVASIPKIVHWIFSHIQVAEQYRNIMLHCQKINPDYHFIFWTDTSGVEFIKLHYPKYLYLFKESFTSGLEFTDALRYFILLHYGGVYADLDVECRLPFSTGLKSYQCIIDREREVQTRVYWGNEFSAMNSVMACRRGHPFFQQAIDKLKISAFHEKGILARTGPMFLTTLFLTYSKTKLSKSNPVILAPSTLFSPLMDANHLPIFRSICQGTLRNDWQKDGCKEFKKNGYSHGNVAELTKNSVAIHKYMHLGWGSWKHHIVARFDACKVVKINIFQDTRKGRN